MVLGNEKAAQYFAAVDPIYKRYLHGKDCLNSCPCHRDPHFQGRFKDSCYPQFQREITPIYEAIFGKAKEEQGNEPGK